MYFQQNNFLIFSAIQRCATDSPADERRAEGGERVVAGRAGGHEPRTQGDEGRPGEYHHHHPDCQPDHHHNHPDLHPDHSDCQYDHDDCAQDQPFTVKNPKLDSNSALAKKRRAKGGQPLPQLQV